MEDSGVRIIGLDTSGASLLVVFSSGNEILWKKEYSEGYKHIEKIGSFVKEGLKFTGWHPDSVDSFFVGVGPGSFTGIRIALSFAKGFSVNNKRISVYPVSSLDIIAASVFGEKGVYFAYAGAGRNEIFYSVYGFDGNKYEKLKKESLGEYYSALGEAEKFGGPLFEAVYDDINPEGIIAAVIMRLGKAESVSVGELSPVYIRKSYAEEKRGEC